ARLGRDRLRAWWLRHRFIRRMSGPRTRRIRPRRGCPGRGLGPRLPYESLSDVEGFRNDRPMKQVPPPKKGPWAVPRGRAAWLESSAPSAGARPCGDVSREAQGMSVNGGGPPVVGIDLGGTKVLAAVVGPGNEILGRSKRPTPASEGADAI